MMESSVLRVFHDYPDLLPLYEAAERAILQAFPDTRVEVKNTQVTFRTKYGFAWAWPPFRRKKDWPKVCMILSFGLDHRMDSPRVVEAANPYPGRWTNHTLVTRPGDLDDELMGWLAQAHAFAYRDNRRKKNDG